MKHIKLKVKEKHGHKWIAVDGGGNVFADPAEEITWSHQEDNLPNDFHATFADKADNPGWPFDSGSSPLIVPKAKNSPVTVKLKSDPNVDWVYKVEVPNSDIDKLDPMIIIRGRSTKNALILAFGAGLLVGALAAWLLLRSDVNKTPEVSRAAPSQSLDIPVGSAASYRS